VAGSPRGAARRDALIDVHGVMHYANAELAYLTGYTHDELVGQNVRC